MSTEIDFSSYSLSELYASAESIDREKFPDKANEIDELIRKREAENPEEIDTSKAIGELATKSDRFVAAIIDGLIGIATMLPLFFVMGMDIFQDPSISTFAGLFLYGALATFLVHGYLLYHYGQTIGKHYMSIRIENLDGTKASLGTIYFMRILPMQAISIIPTVGQTISGIVNPLFIFGKQRRCLHDYIAKTKVSYTE